MRKLLPLLVVSILVLGGLGAIAIPIEKPTEAQPLNTQDSSIEIKVKGGFLGYKVNVTAIDPPLPNGTLKIRIITKLWFMIFVSGFETPLQGPGSYIYWERPVFGFGPANITLDARFTYESGDYVGSTAYGKGFFLLIYVLMEPVEFGLDLWLP